MKYLFIMGPSGSGKTWLAKSLEIYDPERYKWLTQTTTRPPRNTEKEGREYFFLTDTEYDRLASEDRLIGKVVLEFAPFRYGTPILDLVSDRINVIVVSIEGLLHALTKVKRDDKVDVIFIKDVDPEVERESRNYDIEEKYNKIVLGKVRELYQGECNIVQITHDDLKKIRNDKTKLLEYMRKNSI